MSPEYEIYPVEQEPSAFRTIEVSLPTYRYQRALYRGAIHTDILRAVVSVLEHLKPTTRERLFIQGRVITDEQFNKLQLHPVYEFYWQARYMKVMYMSHQPSALKLVLPSGIGLTEKRAASLAKASFRADSLCDEIGHRVGWFRADDLVSAMHATFDSNVLAPSLGGLTDFSIGSTELSTPLLFMVRQRLSDRFCDYLDHAQMTGPERVKNVALRSIGRIISL